MEIYYIYSISPILACFQILFAVKPVLNDYILDQLSSHDRWAAPPSLVHQLGTIGHCLRRKHPWTQVVLSSECPLKTDLTAHNYSKTLSPSDTLMRGHPVIRGWFIRTVSYLPYVKESVTKGHLSCRDTGHVGTHSISYWGVPWRQVLLYTKKNLWCTCLAHATRVQMPY